jgi:orotate phosphoribosyltransferase
MKGVERISELLLETGAYKDLDLPVILTSGELGIYYINTEKLLQDDGAWVKYGDNSLEMISYLNSLMLAKPGFKEVIDIMSEEINSRITKLKMQGKKLAISGGQRRDWLFSGPVAKNLNLDHISLYKQIDDFDPGKFEVISPKTEIINNCDISKYYAFHIVDLITEGSSIYRANASKPKGWVPILRDQGVLIDNLLSVVTRRQGGEERLLEQGVNVSSFVSIDDEFLKKYSKDPKRALEYSKDPSAWSKSYIEQNGAMMFLDVFNPDGGKLERGLKFLSRYKKLLTDLRILDEFKRAIKVKFNLEF